jgi:UDP-N-acetylglucosamine diphosphorylase/glucosamine-1-phosphate N-acetyltransferase
VSSRGTLIAYDDAQARRFEPFALTRPVSSLVAGTMPICERWITAFQMSFGGGVFAPHLADFDEGISAAQTLPAGTLLVNSRFAPALAFLKPDDNTAAWTNNGKVAAVRLAKSMDVREMADGRSTLESVAGEGPRLEIEGWWHEEVWDLLRHLAATMSDDITRIAAMPGGKGKPPEHCTVLGKGPVVVRTSAHADSSGSAAIIDPLVVFDASGGPILIDAGAHIHAFTRINGPCYIGRNATIMGGDISTCSIGQVSKIRGEISSSIVLGYSNKGHDGFVGHSYLGRWVNLGAGTTTSNLKNTYGPVALWTPTGIRPTGMQFLGTLFGDHVKTGIGTNLTTGTVLGAGANVFGATMPPKVVAPFSWGSGEPYDLYKVDKFLASAATVMARRKQTMTERMKRQLTESFERRWSVPK